MGEGRASWLPSNRVNKSLRVRAELEVQIREGGNYGVWGRDARARGTPLPAAKDGVREGAAVSLCPSVGRELAWGLWDGLGEERSPEGTFCTQTSLLSRAHMYSERPGAESPWCS